MDLAERVPQPYKGFHYRKFGGAFIPNADEIDKALEVMKKNNLKNLEINPVYFNKMDLGFLSKFDFVEELSILIDGIENIEPVNSLINLKSISIQHKYKGNINYSNFPYLEKCFMVWGKGAESIFDSTNLKDLTIHNYPKYELLDFGNFENLKRLRFVDGKMVSLTGIEPLQELKDFELFYCYDLENLKGIEKLSKLESFDIESCPHIKSLEALSGNISLKRINFRIKGNVETIRYLSPLFNLEEIYFSDTNITDGDLNVLANLMKSGKLKKASFQKRKHYTHVPEQLGYVVPPEVAKIFKPQK